MDISYIFQQVQSIGQRRYESFQIFEKTCANMVSIWSTMDPTTLVNYKNNSNDKILENLFLFWPEFLSEATLHVINNSPLSSSIPLIECIIASIPEDINNKNNVIALANNECIEKIIEAIISDVRKRIINLTSLIPPLGVLEQLTTIINLFEEYNLLNNDFSNLSINEKLLEVYNSMIDRYCTMFVEEIVFPSYWNLDWKSSSKGVLINGVHPSIYFCFTSMVNLVQGWKKRKCMSDNYSCRQLIMHLWEKSALAFFPIIEEKEFSEIRKQQIKLDILHFIIFARMFRVFIGDRLYKNISLTLVKLLEALSKRFQVLGSLVNSSECFSIFEKNIWNVPPIEDSEWLECLNNSKPDNISTSTTTEIIRNKFKKFIPWSDNFIRAFNVKIAQSPPEGWEFISFQKLL